MQEKLEVLRSRNGFIAALDQSGGSTPKALKSYGIEENAYTNEAEMFNLINTMRKRIVTSNAFTSDYILGTILFKKTLEVSVDGMSIVDYLWNQKHILTFLKIDNGLAEETNGVKLMNPINTDEILALANNNNVFGTKMRSVIYKANREGIRKVVEQQFFYAKKIIEKGLVPIVEPEVDIDSLDKALCEKMIKEKINKKIVKINDNEKIMLKLTLPTENNFYVNYTNHPNILRVVALSGGYSDEIANEKLKNNKSVVASFSRALLNGLNVNQSEEEFNKFLLNKILKIYNASVNK